jgi:uncharacterized membrane protein YkoI
MHRFSLPLILVVALLLGLAALWMAHEEWEAYEYSEPFRSVSGGRSTFTAHGTVLSLEEIVRRLRLPEESRILEVEREEKNGRLYYEIELLDGQGRVRELYVDPRTAEVIEEEEEEGRAP